MYICIYYNSSCFSSGYIYITIYGEPEKADTVVFGFNFGGTMFFFFRFYVWRPWRQLVGARGRCRSQLAQRRFQGLEGWFAATYPTFFLFLVSENGMRISTLRSVPCIIFVGVRNRVTNCMSSQNCGFSFHICWWERNTKNCCLKFERDQNI